MMSKTIYLLLFLGLSPLACASAHSANPTVARSVESDATPASVAAIDPQRISMDAERVLTRANDPLVEDHLWFHRGLGYLYKNAPAKAENFFRDIIVIHPESVYYQDAKLRLAEVLIEMGSFGEAQSLINQYMAAKPDMYKAFEANLLLGRALIGSGEGGRATEHFRWMTTSATEDATLNQVTKYYGELDKRFGAGMELWFADPDIQFRIAQSYYEASQWDQAARRLKKYVLSKDLSSSVQQDAEFLYAKCIARIHRYQEAIDIFKKLDRAGGHVPGLAFWMSRTYAKLNEFDKAIAIRRSMVKHYGRSPTAASYLAKIAFLYVDQGKYERALQEWEDVLAMKPRGKDLMNAQWFTAWSHYRLGNYDESISGFDAIAKSKLAKRYDFYRRAIYWKGRALAEAGRKAEAREQFRKLSGQSDYYGVLARRRLNGDRRNQKNFASTSHVSGSAESDLSHLPPPEEVQDSSIHLARALKLDELGLHREAAKEIRAMDGAGSANPMITLELSRRDRTYDIGRRVALRNYNGTLRGFPQGSGIGRYIWERAYPEAYPTTVRNGTDGSRVDPRLVWSIMKAESNFRPHVVSPAGAVGLMQLMPSTARRLLSGNDAKNFDSRALFEPEVNVGLGVEYVKKLWRDFPGDHVSIIASYNAGEEASGRWLENKRTLAEKDIEQYIEEIPYAETCLYVKRVMSNYWTMQQLYN